MPELPDVIVYLQSLDRLLTGKTLQQSIVKSPFVLRTFDPPIDQARGKLTGFSRSGKRIIWHLENDIRLVFHLMIAGRFHWKKPGKLPTGKLDLIAFQFEHGTMMFTEASSKKRASLRPGGSSTGWYCCFGLRYRDVQKPTTGLSSVSIQKRHQSKVEFNRVFQRRHVSRVADFEVVRTSDQVSVGPHFIGRCDFVVLANNKQHWHVYLHQPGCCIRSSCHGELAAGNRLWVGSPHHIMNRLDDWLFCRSVGLEKEFSDHHIGEGLASGSSHGLGRDLASPGYFWCIIGGARVTGDQMRKPVAMVLPKLPADITTHRQSAINNRLAHIENVE